MPPYRVGDSLWDNHTKIKDLTPSRLPHGAFTLDFGRVVCIDRATTPPDSQRYNRIRVDFLAWGDAMGD